MEYEFISCLTILHHLHSNMSITFGLGCQNTMKKSKILS